jgi:8-oxo-dGTP pyrophosphatase MutT (NUDIX family)
MPETKIGANVVLVDNGKILLLLRSGGWKTGFWGPPGGGADKGETPKQAAVRETFEESGLRIRPDDLKLLIQRTKHDYGMIYFYITDKFSGKGVALSHEHSGFSWVDMKRIDELDTTFQPSELAIIKNYLLSF